MTPRNTSWPDLGDAPEKPRLRMAALGFPDPGLMGAMIRDRRVILPWEPVELPAADAVWICGESARLLPGGIVRVTPPVGEPSVLDPRTRPRLTFFSVPLADSRIRPAYTFDPASPTSIEYAFRQAEAVLRPLAMELLLAHAIAERLPSLRAYRYELTRRGHLVASVDFGGAVGVNQRLALGDMPRASWRAVRQARGIPENFHVTTFAELFARYIDRVDTDLLPPRYRTLPIHLRTGVRVPPRALDGRHSAILTQLADEPLTFEEIGFRLRLEPFVLARALAVLFYAAAITTNPQRNRKADNLAESIPFSNYEAPDSGPRP